MKTVYKYQMPGPGETMDIEIPVGAKFLRLEEQPGQGPQLWVETTRGATTERRRFTCIGTGHDIVETAVYIGTWFQAPFVWHVFEIE